MARVKRRILIQLKLFDDVKSRSVKPVAHTGEGWRGEVDDHITNEKSEEIRLNRIRGGATLSEKPK